MKITSKHTLSIGREELLGIVRGYLEERKLHITDGADHWFDANDGTYNVSFVSCERDMTVPSASPREDSLDAAPCVPRRA